MWVKEFPQTRRDGTAHNQAGVKFISCEIQDKYEGNVVDIKTNEDQSTEDKVKEIENSFNNNEEEEDEIPF